jgi:hypothetical protein
VRFSDPLARAAARRAERTALWDDERFREARESDLAQPLTGISSVLRAMVVCVVLSILLTTGKLVEIAERQPLGASRDRWLELAEAVDRVANFLALNRPYDLIIDLRGAGDEAGQRIDTIDEVAARAGIDTTRPSTSVTTVPSSAVAPAPTDAATGDPSPTTTAATPTTTAAVPALRRVTAATPLTVHVAGDSQAEFLGQALATDSGDRSLDVTTDHQISTSLARPDYFNWPAELAEVIETDDPEAIVLFLGANEYQDMVSADGTRLVRGSEEWGEEWTHRLAITLDLIEADHRRVFWVAQPPMRDGRVNDGVALVNELAEPVIAARPHATFVGIWDLFGGDGDYRERVTGPDGDPIRARVDDGIHLTRDAAGWVADLVLAEMDQVWDFVGS